MIPNREGLFNAYPAEVGVDETGPNKLATCIIKFHLYEELQASGEWADCAADNFEITGYFYLEKKDGSLGPAFDEYVESRRLVNIAAPNQEV